MTVPTEAAPAPSTPPAVPAPTTAPAVAPFAQPAPATSVAPPTTDPHAEAVAVAELCLLAGCPERTTEFLASRLSASQVRQVLLQARADQVEIASHHLADAAPTAAATSANPVADAVRKRLGTTPAAGA